METEILVDGFAIRNVKCDFMEIMINFNEKGFSPKGVLSKIQANIETFLEQFKADFGTLSCIRMDNDHINTSHYHEKNFSLSGKRTIIISLPYSMEVQNAILANITDGDFNVDYSVSYKISNIQEVENELLKEALLNSKSQVEIIAAITGQKIVGIRRIEKISDDFEPRMDYKIYEEPTLSSKNRKVMLSESLESPEQTIEKQIEVMWVLG
ncbi:SIMPL domain-containing protein [Fundicoccus culcitae]|uniref:SIMPL domain-containing protein n=1 Tax=Fundicoccus culcitae TaxID=2969821 RepID=A0ABY5P893_9LACT|nr:SIMPL domain-containing protein [Fundicoccus culcitae]UUX34810.1 SIMPL domain-containing protein [Fundicoccus culcitae]